MRKKLTSIVAVLSLVATLLLSLPMHAYAAEPGPDNNSLTIHKYATTTESSQIGTGQELSAEEAAKLGETLNGAEFTLYKVDSTWKPSSTATVTELIASAKASAGTTVAKTGVTAGAGLIEWTGLADGYYVLSETETPEGYLTSPDTIFQLPFGYNPDFENSGVTTEWNHNVHVYPKNAIDKDIIKEVTDDNEAYSVGSIVNWAIEGKIKGNLVNNEEDPATYGKFVIRDKLDARLTFGNDTSDLSKTEHQASYTGDNLYLTGTSNGTVALDRTTDYTRTITGDTVEWALTEAGMDKAVALGARGVRVEFQTYVNKNAFGGDPTIKNDGEMVWRNHDDSEDQSAKTGDGEGGGETPEIEVSRIEITKVDAKTGEKLAGVKFTIALANSDDIVELDGNAYTVTTDANGYATFVGLDPGNYYLVEVEAPAEYMLQDFSDEIITLAKDTIEKVEVTNTKLSDSKFQLPKTGGIGTILFTILGVVLIAGAVVILAKTRKKGQSK